EHEILWPVGGAEDMEFAFRQVPPDGLVAVPVQPDGTEEEQEEGGPANAAQVAKQAGEGAGIDLLAARVEIDGGVLGRSRGDVLDGNLFAHQCIPRRLIGSPGRYVPARVNFTEPYGTPDGAPSGCDRRSR